MVYHSLEYAMETFVNYVGLRAYTRKCILQTDLLARITLYTP